MKLLSFGEVLWDVYTDAKYIGGAPLNFAAHFVINGHEAYMVSAIGEDKLGEDTLEALSQWHIKTDYIGCVQNKKTGQCLVELDEHSVPTYHLLSDVAYDYIPLPQVQDKTFDVLYFGTLALRSSYNLETLQAMVNYHQFSDVFVDVNIRPPHYSKQSIQFAFQKASIIKISEEELPIVLKEIDISENEDYGIISKDVCDKYPNLKLVIITCGENGAFVYERMTQQNYQCKAKKVVVASTVGAGDSFSATFLAQYLNKKSIPECLDLATKVSAFVVSNTAAIPNYNVEDL